MPSGDGQERLLALRGSGNYIRERLAALTAFSLRTALQLKVKGRHWKHRDQFCMHHIEHWFCETMHHLYTQ